MTFEHRMAANLSEVKAVVFECVTCNARIALCPEDIIAPPHHCPKGHSWDWNMPEQYQTMGSPILAFLHALKNLRNPLIEKNGFRISLEYDARPWRTSDAE
jgi:hypothetical protein